MSVHSRWHLGFLVRWLFVGGRRAWVCAAARSLGYGRVHDPHIPTSAAALGKHKQHHRRSPAEAQGVSYTALLQPSKHSVIRFSFLAQAWPAQYTSSRMRSYHLKLY